MCTCTSTGPFVARGAHRAGSLLQPAGHGAGASRQPTAATHRFAQRQQRNVRVPRLVPGAVRVHVLRVRAASRASRGGAEDGCVRGRPGAGRACGGDLAQCRHDLGSQRAQAIARRRLCLWQLALKAGLQLRPRRAAAAAANGGGGDCVRRRRHSHPLANRPVPPPRTPTRPALPAAARTVPSASRDVDALWMPVPAGAASVGRKGLLPVA
jgi:hypothetical protein